MHTSKRAPTPSFLQLLIPKKNDAISLYVFMEYFLIKIVMSLQPFASIHRKGETARTRSAEVTKLFFVAIEHVLKVD